MAARSRVRYDRMTALLVATGTTLFAFLSGMGTFGPVSAEGAPQQTRVGSTMLRAERAMSTATPQRAGVAVEASARHEATDQDGSTATVALPAGSGAGKRVVFDMSDQRVWLVGANGSVVRSYLVSGSVTDNLKPGRYRVYSRSRHAVGVEDSGTMQYFVRFTRGQNAAIGFHDIPVDHGHYVQTTAQLGTPQSHGCIRQYRPDAIQLWNFAPVGTQVSVVA
ncbi:L,D-transpeptidase [Nocardioides mangrovicus]|uniref:L,D-transpeptidase n=1 Tax=Nocardioides mangrovicus TaxID=2478913 RepID=UPI000EF78A3D|nr:L,D-transpeptidase [Nocardioides mangrovicus]